MKWKGKHTPGWLLLIMLAASASAALFRYFWYVSPWLVPPDLIGGQPTVADKISAVEGGH
jgi:hypothetical protein